MYMKKFKKILISILSLTIIFSLSACKNKTNNEGNLDINESNISSSDKSGEISSGEEKPLVESKILEDGERTITIINKFDVPNSVKNDPKWNVDTLYNQADYGQEIFLDEKILCYQGTIKSNGEKHDLKIYFLGYMFDEYTNQIFEIEVDGNITKKVIADEILIVDLDEQDGYKEILAKNQWELACDYTVYRYVNGNVSVIGGIPTVKGIEELRAKDGKYFTTKLRFAEETIISEYFNVLDDTIESVKMQYSEVAEKEFTVTKDTLKDLAENCESLKEGDKIKLMPLTDDYTALSENSFYGGSRYRMMNAQGEILEVGKYDALSR